MRFQFLHEYFKQEVLNDFENRIFIAVKEKPSFNIKEEDYSLRLETCHKEDVHRNYAIEHHLKQDKHDVPHLQFKFHSEKIGSIWLNLFFKNEEEYKKGIEGFIFHSKHIFEDLENEHPNLTREMMFLENVLTLQDQGTFLQEKITQSIQEGLIEFQNILDKDKKELIKSHILLNKFIGSKNVALLLGGLE